MDHDRDTQTTPLARYRPTITRHPYAPVMVYVCCGADPTVVGHARWVGTDYSAPVPRPTYRLTIDGIDLDGRYAGWFMRVEHRQALCAYLRGIMLRRLAAPSSGHRKVEDMTTTPPSAARRCAAVPAPAPPPTYRQRPLPHPDAACARTPATPTENFLDIAQTLVETVQDSPFAVGLWFLIARLAFAAQGPIPLSRGDIQHLDPAAKPGAIKRALDRLTTEGWLLPTSGYKTSYLPTWGRGRDGVARPWRMGCGARKLGCPPHVATIRIERALLDVFLGKLTPRARHTTVERYVTAPLLSLSDVGTYLLLRAGVFAAPSDALVRWRLTTEDRQPGAFPETPTILALVSQRTTPEMPQLTESGWRVLGIPPAPPAPVEAPTPAIPFLAPPELIGERIGRLIGEWIGERIGCDTQHTAAYTAFGCAPTHHDATAPSSQGVTGNHSDLRESSPPPMGGGNHHDHTMNATQAPSRPDRNAADRTDDRSDSGDGAPTNRSSPIQTDQDSPHTAAARESITTDPRYQGLRARGATDAQAQAICAAHPEHWTLADLDADIALAASWPHVTSPTAYTLSVWRNGRRLTREETTDDRPRPRPTDAAWGADRPPAGAGGTRRFAGGAARPADRKREPRPGDMEYYIQRGYHLNKWWERAT